MDDEFLVRQILGGDELAAAMLISLYGARLAGFARGVAGDLSDADREVICETAIEKAIRKMDRFDPKKGTLFGWLRAFVRTEVLSWRRSMKRMTPFEDQAAQDHPHDASSPQTLEAARVLAGLMKELKETDQLILSLRELDGLSYREISLRLGDVSEEACRQRHVRAVARLRALAEREPRLEQFVKGGSNGRQTEE